MEEKTSKVKEIVRVNPYTGSHGTVYYHDLVMDNGDKINIGKKKEVQSGWELSYMIVGDQKDDGTYQQEYPKAKSVQLQAQQSRNGQYKKQSNVASFALAYAKDMAVAHIEKGNEFKADDVLKVATKFNQWLQENS